MCVPFVNFYEFLYVLLFLLILRVGYWISMYEFLIVPFFYFGLQFLNMIHWDRTVLLIQVSQGKERRMFFFHLLLGELDESL